MDEEAEAQRGQVPCLNPTLAVNLILGDNFANFGENEPCVITSSADEIIRYGILRGGKKWEVFQKKNCCVFPPSG